MYFHNYVIYERDDLLDKSGKQHRDEHYYRNAEKRKYRNYNVLTESIVMDRHHTEEDEEAGPNICNSQKHRDKGYLIECDKVGDDRKRDDEQGAAAVNA